MKYEPRLPDHNDNVSHQNPVREFLLLLAGLSLFAACVFWILGLLVDAAVDRMSPETEARINRAVAFKWEQDKPFSVERQALLQKLADDLKQCAGLQQQVTVHLTESKQANAAVFPGGHIVVFSGLLERVQSENGLSFVLAHEFSHLANRDHLRAMGRSLVLVGISALLTGSHSGLTQILVPINRIDSARFSQGREMAADARALQIVHCRYGHAGGVTEFFDSISSQDNQEQVRVMHRLSTHPELQTRIGALQRMMRDQQMQEGPTIPLRLPR